VLRPLRSALVSALAIGLAACGGSTVGSVGAVIGVDNETGAVHVRELREGAAADKAGLAVGDEILMIDGLYVRDIGVPAVKQKLAGDAGTSIDLTVVRGDQVMHVKLVREPIGGPVAPPKPKEERLAP
jgi:carboxyl-terminal processing protease